MQFAKYIAVAGLGVSGAAAILGTPLWVFCWP